MKFVKKPLNALYFTQFLSAFSDNMIYFIVLSLVVKNELVEQSNVSNYMGMVQLGFLFAYVLLAAFVGPLADKHAKSHILLCGNAIKSLGIFLLILDVNPIISYAIVGIGAVIYSPAKYGILPELTTTKEELHHANAKLEAFTILSILLGGVIGTLLANFSIPIAMTITFILYLISLFATLLIPKIKGDPTVSYKRSFIDFFRDFKTLLSIRKSRFSLVGTGSFWLSSATLRVAFLAWIPLILSFQADSIWVSGLVAVTAIGIVIGSFLTPKIIPVHRFYNAYRFGLLLVVVIFLLNFVPTTHTLALCFTIFVLLAIGFIGGVFVVPMNTAIQEVGKETVGNGRTIAIQNFVNNLMMILGIVFYNYLTSTSGHGLGLSHPIAINFIGIIVLVFVSYLTTQLNSLKKGA